MERRSRRLERKDPFGRHPRLNRAGAEDAAELSALLGPGKVSVDEERIRTYSRDEVPPAAMGGPHPADLLVFPESAEEVAAVARYCHDRRIPITPRGAGTGLSGGAVPARGGVLLSFERMNRILEIDEANLCAVVEPGVVTAEIDRAAAARGLAYVGDPCSGDASFIGGNVAENAGGNKVVRYGATGAQILGLETVLPNGSLVRFGGKRRKDVTGYDFARLLAGSEGTLALIVRIILRLLPRPRRSAALLCPFRTLAEAVAFVPRIAREVRVIPTSAELMDRRAVALAERYLSTRFPHPEAGAHLILELEGNHREELADRVEAVGDLCLASGALEVYVAEDRTSRDRLWRARKSVGEAIGAFYSKFAKEDLVVPTSAVPELVEAVGEAAVRWGLDSVTYGHVGDGNLHVNLLADDLPEADRRLGEARRFLYGRTLELGGTLSGEHGIGLKRRRDAGLFLSPEERALIRRVKRAFDPAGILNPGKIVEGN
jgi:glycolate oxidase